MYIGSNRQPWQTSPKPESAITFTDKDAKAVVIAHWLKVTTQMLSDAPALQSFIDNILRHGLNIKLERQILAGDGTNGNMLGLILKQPLMLHLLALQQSQICLMYCVLQCFKL